MERALLLLPLLPSSPCLGCLFLLGDLLNAEEDEAPALPFLLPSISPRGEGEGGDPLEELEVESLPGAWGLGAAGGLPLPVLLAVLVPWEARGATSGPVGAAGVGESAGGA